MKFIHIADVHLGMTPDREMNWGEQRKKEIFDTLNRVISSCNEEKVDLLLIAGDLFHCQPLLRDLKEINYSFSKLVNTQVVMIAGNHDYIGIRSYYKDFAWAPQVHFILEDRITKIELEELHTEVYGFSYHQRNIEEAVLKDASFDSNDKLHILLAHCGEEKNVPINKKELLGKNFDYVALGHIHKPEIFGERAAFCGSLEPLDKTELGEHGYIYGELDEKTRAIKVLKFCPISRRIYIQKDIICNKESTNGKIIDELRAYIKDMGEDNIYRFRLKGVKEEGICFDINAIMELGNVVEVIDEVVPDYDFEELYLENQDNIIGLYIDKIRNSEGKDSITQKALYYGIEALLGARNH